MHDQKLLLRNVGKGKPLNCIWRKADLNWKRVKKVAEFEGIVQVDCAILSPLKGLFMGTIDEGLEYFELPLLFVTNFKP